MELVVKHEVIHEPANDMKLALENTEKILGAETSTATSIITGETKVIELVDKFSAISDTSLSNLSIRDGRITPKQNYSRIDPSKVNIFAHKGPDEYKGGGITS